LAIIDVIAREGFCATAAAAGVPWCLSATQSGVDRLTVALALEAFGQPFNVAYP
jgi:hypothetical protein